LGTWVAAAGDQILLDTSIQCRHRKRWSLSSMVKTDVCQRGVPWIDLLLRSGRHVETLSVTPSQRLSVLLVGAALVLVGMSFWWPWMCVAVAAAFLVLTCVNLRLYRFFLATRGPWFAIRVLPTHWLYYVCCGISVVLGTILHYSRRMATAGRTR
jgi:hypothetical protein